MTALKKESRINLLPKEEFDTSTMGRVLRWTLSTFRVIVIITEVVVLGAFLSRFWLDVKSSDLNNLITQKEAVIKASSDFEKTFRLTQNRIRIFNTLASEEPISEVFDTISSYLPGNVWLTSVTSQKNSMQLRGSSTNEQGIAQLIANLEASGQFGEVVLQQVGVAEDGYFMVFTLNLILGQKGGE